MGSCVQLMSSLVTIMPCTRAAAVEPSSACVRRWGDGRAVRSSEASYRCFLLLRTWRVSFSPYIPPLPSPAPPLLPSYLAGQLLAVPGQKLVSPRVGRARARLVALQQQGRGVFESRFPPLRSPPHAPHLVDEVGEERRQAGHERADADERHREGRERLAAGAAGAGVPQRSLHPPPRPASATYDSPVLLLPPGQAQQVVAGAWAAELRGMRRGEAA